MDYLSIKPISTGQYKIHSSGTVICLKNEETKLIVNGTWTIVFVFKVDSEEVAKKTPRLEKVAQGKELRCTFYNFSDSLGTTTPLPDEIGTINNHKLFMQLFIIAHPTDNYLVHYELLTKNNDNEEEK